MPGESAAGAVRGAWKPARNSLPCLRVGTRGGPRGGTGNRASRSRPGSFELVPARRCRVPRRGHRRHRRELDARRRLHAPRARLLHRGRRLRGPQAHHRRHALRHPAAAGGPGGVRRAGRVEPRAGAARAVRAARSGDRRGPRGPDAPGAPGAARPLLPVLLRGRRQRRAGPGVRSPAPASSRRRAPGAALVVRRRRRHGRRGGGAARDGVSRQHHAAGHPRGDRQDAGGAGHGRRLRRFRVPLLPHDRRRARARPRVAPRQDPARPAPGPPHDAHARPRRRPRRVLQREAGQGRRDGDGPVHRRGRGPDARGLREARRAAGAAPRRVPRVRAESRDRRVHRPRQGRVQGRARLRPADHLGGRHP